MEGFVQFAQTVVKTISKISPFPVSLSNDEGYIIGDTDSSRIGTLHTPSIEVIETNRVISLIRKKLRV